MKIDNSERSRSSSLHAEDNFLLKTTKRATNSKNKRRNLLNPVYFNVGAYLIVPLLLGVFLGYHLDKRLNSKPIFVFAGIIFGTISAFYNLWKLLKEQ